MPRPRARSAGVPSRETHTQKMALERIDLELAPLTPEHGATRVRCLTASKHLPSAEPRKHVSDVLGCVRYRIGSVFPHTTVTSVLSELQKQLCKAERPPSVSRTSVDSAGLHLLPLFTPSVSQFALVVGASGTTEAAARHWVADDATEATIGEVRCSRDEN